MDISTDFTFYYTKESGDLLEAKGRVASPQSRKKKQLPGQAEKAPLLTGTLESPTSPSTILKGKKWPFHSPGYYYLWST